VYANTGAGTIEKAVDMATHDFLARGIDCIEYRNGARHTISDWADMAVRTAERRAYLAGEGRKRQEWGVSLVIVNRRGTMTGGNHGRACPQCVPWLGKILIDDVYSGGKADGKHTLLSEAMAAGFLHPRCKDGFTTYFPDISSTPDPATRGEIREAVEAEKEENRENYVQRQADKFDRLARYSLDPENKRKYAARAAEWKGQLKPVNTVVEKPVNPGIIAAGKAGKVADVRDLCELDREKLKEEFPDLPTSKVVLTGERVEHIRSHHPEDFALFEKHAMQTIIDPDCILLDAKNPSTVMFIRSAEDSNLNVIIRLALADDVKTGKSHSVMTSHRLGVKNLKRLKKKNKILYIRE
jgi:hypothetical protein